MPMPALAVIQKQLLRRQHCGERGAKFMAGDGHKTRAQIIELMQAVQRLARVVFRQHARCNVVKEHQNATAFIPRNSGERHLKYALGLPTLRDRKRDWLR